jgi:hypothetical protein
MDETTTLGIIAFALQFTIVMTSLALLNCKVREKKTCKCCSDPSSSDPLNP